jgi:hypothetical protein
VKRNINWALKLKLKKAADWETKKTNLKFGHTILKKLDNEKMATGDSDPPL